MCSGSGGGTAGSTKPGGPQLDQPGGPEQALVGGGQEEAVARRARPPAGAAHPLQERRDGARGVDLDHAVEVADVDAQLQGAGGHDHAVAALGERPLGLPALVQAQRAVRDERRDAAASAARRRAARPAPGCRRRPAASRPGAGPRSPWRRCPGGRRSRAATSGGGSGTAGGRITRRGRSEPAESQASSSSSLPTVADRPIRWRSRPASRPIRCSSASRCQPRSSRAKAWTSSTTTARTPANSRSWRIEAETSITSSDSGVVSRQSGGSSRIRFLAEAGHVAVPDGRPAAHQAVVPLQPLLLVVQQGLDRADVEDGQPAPGAGQGLGDQREEGRLGLAAGGRGQHQQVGPVQRRRRWPAPAPAAAIASPGR